MQGAEAPRGGERENLVGPTVASRKRDVYTPSSERGAVLGPRIANYVGASEKRVFDLVSNRRVSDHGGI